MINLDYIKSFYSQKEQKFDQFLLKEYLQYQILNIIFSSKYSAYLSFLGWTAIRLVFNSNRFSEDLDFDNFWLDENDFEDFSKNLKFELEKLWFGVEIKNVYKWAYRCYIRLPKILKELWFSDLDDEKILIQIDTVKQDYKYESDKKILDKFESDKKILDKFDVYKLINVCPVSIILSKKIHALIDRKRIKWRDFFDIVFLYGLTKPDFEYLGEKTWIKNTMELQQRLINFCTDLDLKELAQDVKPFLINQDEIHRVMLFREFIESL